jgi:hypothetical protein
VPGLPRRAWLRRNLLLVFHHACFMVIVLVGFFARSIFSFKLGLILDVFATYEAVLYVALVARRLGASRRLLRGLLIAGIGFYGGDLAG